MGGNLQTTERPIRDAADGAFASIATSLASRLLPVRQKGSMLLRAEIDKSNSASPARVDVSAPHGIAIGGGTVTNPTVNNFTPPAPRVFWSVVDTEQPEDRKRPRTSVKIYLDRAFVDAKFAVRCDRPCDAIGTGSCPGFNQAKFAKYRIVQSSQRFIIIGPNPFPSYTNYELQVESQDEQPVQIVSVGRLTLTQDTPRE